MRIVLAKPRGFCAGVERAINIVERALSLYGTPLYVRHEVVHNRTVVESFQQRGVRFIEELAEVPPGSVVIFSAHGVSQAVRQQAKQRELTVFDATCPLVTKVHMEVARASRAGIETILIGHQGHPEVEGTLGQYQNPQGAIYLVETCEQVAALAVNQPERLHFVTQTTLSLEDTAQIIQALQARFPKIIGSRKEDICYATSNRQRAVRELAAQVDIVLVIGSSNSSNSNRLVEVAQRLGKPAYLIDQAEMIQKAWLEGVTAIGVTAGASAPERLVQQVINQLRTWGGEEVSEQIGIEEEMSFALPRALQIPVIREEPIR
ncbi:MAG: 4-hydroxy-3-methylbut-2-enyl diphosphate reductase [Candidatus Symbiodolus clandestinus]